MSLDFYLLLQTIFFGIFYYGCTYVLLSLGLNLVFGVTKIFFLGYGELVSVTAYGIYWITALMPALNPYSALFLTIPIILLIIIPLEKFCFRKTLGKPSSSLLVNLGLMLFFENFMIYLWGSIPKRVVSPLEILVFNMGMLAVNADQLLIILITFICTITLHLFIKKTKTGKSLRATAQESEGAVLVGINPFKMSLISFILSSLIACMAGLFVSFRNVAPTQGGLLSFKALTVVIVGGLGNFVGGIIAGIILGCAEALTLMALGGFWSNAVMFMVLILILLIRPRGIFGG
jgi:branched-chain amino acid transport system permease protein